MSDFYMIDNPTLQPQDIGSKTIKRAIWLDDSVCKGAPYFEMVWIVNDITVSPGMHHHDFDEFLGFMGGNIDDPMELGCDIQVLVAGEVLDINKTCLIFIPAGVEHGIISVSHLTTPVLNYSGGPNVTYLPIS